MLVVVGFQLLVRRLKLAGHLGVVAVGLVVELHEVDIILQLSGSAQAGMEHVVAGGVAVGQGGLLQLRGGVFQIIALLRGQLKAVGVRLGGHGAVIHPGIQRSLQEELLPGAAFLGQRTNLGVKALGNVQAEVGGVSAVLGHEVAELHPVVYLQLPQGQLILPGGGHDLVPGGHGGLVLGGIGALAGHVVRVAVGGHGGGLSGFRLGSFRGGLFGGGFLRGHGVLGDLHVRDGVGRPAVSDAEQHAHRQDHHGHGGHDHQNGRAGLQRSGLPLGVILAAAGADRCPLRQLGIAKRTMFHFRIPFKFVG